MNSMDSSQAVLREVEDELQRLDAADSKVALDGEFEPEAGELIRFEHDGAVWRMMPEHFLELLQDLPDNAGGERVHAAIEQAAFAVWHGPAPKGSRDT